MKYPVGYLIFPPIIIELFWSAGWFALIFGAFRESKGTDIALSIAASGLGLFALLGIPISFWLNKKYLIALDPETSLRVLELQAKIEMMKIPKPKKVVLQTIIDDHGKIQGDDLHGLTPQEWYSVARRVVAINNFTVRTVGETIRPKLIPLLEPIGYIVKKLNKEGEWKQGEYDNTKKGLAFWKNLKRTPPHLWDQELKIIAALR